MANKLWITLSLSLLKYIKSHGNFCMAYSTLQNGFSYYVDEHGYIAYSKKWNQRFAFFDPVVHCKEKESLLKVFCETHNPIFIQISEDTAKILEGLGYSINSFGVETRIFIHDFSISGTPRARLREAVNRAEKKGVRILEIDNKFDFKSLQHISSEWMETRAQSKKETRYITRPASFEQEQFVRKFAVLQGEHIVGFSFYDPIFANEEIIGYTPYVSRFMPNSIKGINYFTNCKCIEIFKSEGIQFIDLGLSPLYNINDSNPTRRKAISAIFRYLFQHGNYFYNFKGLSEHKRQYHGHESQTYVALRSGWSLTALVKAFSLMNLI